MIRFVEKEDLGDEVERKLNAAERYYGSRSYYIDFPGSELHANKIKKLGYTVTKTDLGFKIS